MKKDTKKVFIKNFGCQMNTRDSEVICGLLRTAHYELTANPKEADVVIFNTCSVRQHAEDKAWSEIGRISKAKYSKGQSPSGKVPIIGLVGCMAQNYQEKVFERSPDVGFVVGPSDIDKIPGIIKKLLASKKEGTVPCPPAGRESPKFLERKIWETDGQLRPEEIYHTGFYEDKDHAYVVISEGCSNFCSYCVVPFVRGPLHNRDHKAILKEIEEAVDQGITKITLLGQNVNAYKDGDINFVKLIELVNSIKGLKEFSFITSHPKDTSLDLFRVMADCQKLQKALHLPIQSGADKILKLMNRGYGREDYLKLAKTYRKIVKRGALSTDIIVGFPTETEKDFQETFDLVDEIKFNSAYIFKYSSRLRTQASNMLDDVPKLEKERRHKLILGLQRKISNKLKCYLRKE
ncbi:MAG: tRNA (N6-isopentenyl adenosine(37)-C2)-methylthiotransferase MiaB [Candidatus Omnitrophica bacterium]|nr:tRNA (N6-isopentenyl adenosine(37)-C2)-methylthiotransferase MiaB [Candidatus Omnitrophota bacterium]